MRDYVYREIPVDVAEKLVELGFDIYVGTEELGVVAIYNKKYNTLLDIDGATCHMSFIDFLSVFKRQYYTFGGDIVLSVAGTRKTAEEYYNDFKDIGRHKFKSGSTLGKTESNELRNNERKFYKLISTYLTDVDGIYDLYNWLVREDFFTAPASTKYHGNYEGGLCEHSVNVCECIIKLLNSEPFKGMNVDIKSAVLVSLFHDICKVNYYSKTTRNVKNETTGRWEKVPYYTVKDQFPAGHGEKSVMLIQRYVKLNPDEIMAINWHMGFSDNRAKDSQGMSQVSQAFKEYPLAFLLHTADMMATYYLDGKM